MITTQTPEWTAAMALLEDAINHDDAQNPHLDRVLFAAEDDDHAQSMYAALSSRASATIHMTLVEGLWARWLVYFVNRDMAELGLHDADEATLMGALRDASKVVLEAMGLAPGSSDAEPIRPTAKHVHCAYALVRALEDWDEDTD